MNVSEFYKYSWFSDLAYVDWDNNHKSENKAVDAAVAAKRAPQKLAEKIFLSENENYSVLSHFANEDSDTGFKASLYGNGSEKILSICGTEPQSKDLWIADLTDIRNFGVAINQAVSMFNYIMRLAADKDTTDVLQLSWELHSISATESLPTDQQYIIDRTNNAGMTYFYVLEANNNGAGLGEIFEGDTITLTGHSLGGHLAAFAQRLFPQLFDQTVTFNAPGFDPITANGGVEKIVGMFEQYMTASPASSFESLSDRIFTIEEEDTAPGDDTDMVSGEITGTPPTEEIFVTTEVNSHSMDQLVDALGVQSLLKTLNPSWGLKETGCLISICSADPGYSEETLLNGLSRIILQDNSELPRGEAVGYWVSAADFNARTQLHARLNQLEQAVSKQSLRIEAFATADEDGNITPLSASDIESLAKTDIAYRYALVNLNPFAVLGTDYTEFNKEGKLDLYTPSTIDGQLSNKYLTDRAEMLYHLIVRNINDGYNESIIHFEDKTSGEVVFHSDSQLVPQKTIVFGSNQGDEIHGQKASAEHPYIGDTFDDHLYGMGGNDIIQGYGGDDYIEGGKGQDTMYGGDGNDIFYVQGEDEAYDTFNGGDDTDTILGSSGDDTIRIHNFTGANRVEIIDGNGGGDVIEGTDMSDRIDLSETAVTVIEAIRGGDRADTITLANGGTAVINDFVCGEYLKVIESIKFSDDLRSSLCFQV